MSASPGEATVPTPGADGRPALTILVAAAGLFLVALDFSINVSLPTMRDSLGASLIGVQGIIIFYHASRSSLAPASGGLGDSFGLKRVFLAGVAAYTLAVGLISLQAALGPVLVLRVLQGAGAGALFTAGPALVARAFGMSKRGAALGVTIGAVSAGQLTATLGGGWLSQSVGWEAIFYARLPVGLLVLVLGGITLNGRPPPRVAPSDAGRTPFDWLGAAILAGALFALVLAIAYARPEFAEPALVAGFLLAALALFLAHRLRQARAAFPLLPRDLWGAPGFRTGAVSNVLLTVGGFPTWFLFPFYVADVLGRGPMVVGVMLATFAAAATAGSVTGGWLADRIGDRAVTFMGATVTALGSVWIAGLGETAALAAVGLRVAVAGGGFGLHQAAVYSLVMRHTRREHAGAASATLAVAQTIGTPLSILLGTAVFAWRERLALDRGLADATAFADAFRGTYLAAAGAALLAGFIVIRFRRSAPSDRRAPPAP